MNHRKSLRIRSEDHVELFGTVEAARKRIFVPHGDDGRHADGACHDNRRAAVEDDGATRTRSGFAGQRDGDSNGFGSLLGQREGWKSRTG